MIPNNQPVGYHLGAALDGTPINSFGYAVDAFGGHLPTFPDKVWTAMRPDQLLAFGSQAAEYNLGRSGAHMYACWSPYVPRPGWSTAGSGSTWLAASRTGLSWPANELTANILDQIYATPPYTKVMPSGWPELRMQVYRFHDTTSCARVVAVIGFINPTTGAQRTCTLRPMATSLRGAREQRQWAHWGGSRLDQ
ncbi:MAG: hypothetical protein H0W72_09530 [Planctomycetes bacterium]|nr:hypothetical protein [Planctomycetota bacterium]